MSNGADPRTPHLDLVLPIVGDEAGEDLWGDKTNANWAKVDDNAAQVADDLNTIFEQALPDAPADSVLYGRLDQTWSPVPLYDNPDWADIANKPAQFPPTEHNHPIDEVITLQAELDAKEPTIAAGTAADFWRGDKTWQTIASVVGIGEAPTDGSSYARQGSTASWQVVAMDWASLAGKPATFPPSAHNHPISQVTNLQPTLDGKEPVISAGTTAQFWRGDKTWQALSSITVDAYTKAQSDAKYEPFDSAYTKAEADARYEPFDSAYTKAEGDAKYEPKIATGNPAYYWAGDKTWKAVAVSAGVSIAEAPPPTPANGQLWWEADTGRMFIFVVDATGPGQWVETSGGSTVPTVILSDTVPPFKLNGLWYNTANGTLSFGYRDANTDQWVAIVGGGTLAGSGAYLPLAGGVMTGAINIVTPTIPTLALKAPAPAADYGKYNAIDGYAGDKLRWSIWPASGAPEGGANSGSDFEIGRYNDAGVFIDVPLMIKRDTGKVWLKGEDIAWKTLPMINGWIDYGSGYAPAQYRKLSSGLVVVQGLIKNGTSGVICSALPAGYQPSGGALIFTVQSGANAACRVDVTASGLSITYAAGGGNSYVSLAGIQYYAGL